LTAGGWIAVVPDGKFIDTLLTGELVVYLERVFLFITLNLNLIGIFSFWNLGSCLAV